MFRPFKSLVLFGLLAACGSATDGDGGAGGSAGASSGGAGGSGGSSGEAGTGGTDKGGNAGTGGAATCPTKNLPATSRGMVVSAVVFAGKKITLANIGNDEIPDQDLWVCNGSRCESLDPVKALAPGTEVTATLFVPRLAPEGGELAVYLGNDFRDATSMLAYLRWGKPEEEGRASLAVTAGLWPSTGESVPMPAGALGLLIVGQPGSAAGFAAVAAGCQTKM